MAKAKLNPNALKWVKALESGKFKQTQEVLTRIKGKTLSHCCLGVACEIAIKNGVKLEVGEEYGIRLYDNSRVMLPRKVKNWLGLSKPDGWVSGHERSLVMLNDIYHKNFKEIAAVIRSMPNGLFSKGKPK